MPEDISFRSDAELMQDDEIITLVKVFAQLGFDKFRLTDGEPTVRANVVELVREIASVPGVKNLTMTTNGVTLIRLAKPLAEAGLQRVNISIDTLDSERFRH
jgi:cyclic pyranopterin phosphate synthase